MVSATNAALAGAHADTGRLKATLDPVAQMIIFGEVADRAIQDDFPWMAEVDKAHLLMLTRTGLLPSYKVQPLMRRIDEMQKSGFVALQGRPAPRGAYMLYEAHLIAELGEPIGGMLQTARSRNDLSSTVFRLRLREKVADLLIRLLRLNRTLLWQAKRYANVTMPIYTHYQPAQPISLGHYYAAIVTGLDRDVAALIGILDALSLSPLGAGAVAGTSLPIDQHYTARLLGFAGVCPNSIDAVGARDTVLRLLAALGVMGVTLSRLAHDLQLWTMGESSFLHVPDTLVGSSSMMPQKRNAYLLEHIKGMSAAPMGALQTATMAMHATPYTNSIAVGTEGTKPVWTAMDQITSALTLTRLIVRDATPDRERMLQRARTGQTTATALADWLVANEGLSFRAAHHEIGELTRAMLASGGSDLDAYLRLHKPHWFTVGGPAFDPGSVANRQEQGGGPGSRSVADQIAALAQQQHAHHHRLRTERARWRNGRQALQRAVKVFPLMDAR